MSRLMKYLTVVCFILLTTYAYSSNLNGSAKTVPLPDSYIFLQPAVIDSIGITNKEFVKWPDMTIVKGKVINIDDPCAKKALASTYEWLSKILKTRWLPSIDKIDIYAIKGDVQGIDTIRMRYSVNGYAFQIASTSSGLIVVMQEIYSELEYGYKVNKEEVDRYISTRLEDIYNNAESIIRNTNRSIKKGEYGFYGVPSMKGNSSSFWWGLTYWWTDGNALILSIGKADASGPVMKPSLKKNWFNCK